MFQFNQLFDELFTQEAQSQSQAKPRLTGLRRRSPAQIEASRINGAKSNGPKTRRSRTRSCTARHGFLARKVIPIADGRHEDAEYRGLLAGLVLEFAPSSTLDWAWVELLAHDLLQLGRVKQLIEVVMTTDMASCGAAKEYPLDVQQHVDLVESVIQLVKDGQRLSCSPEDSAWLAMTIREMVDGLADTSQQVTETRAAGEPVDEDDEQEGRLYAQINGESLLADDDSIRAVLSGQLKIAPEHAERWMLLFQEILAATARSLEVASSSQRLFDRQYRQHHQSKLLERLPSLEVLMRYEAQFRKCIERTTRLLAARQLPRGV